MKTSLLAEKQKTFLLLLVSSLTLFDPTDLWICGSTSLTKDIIENSRSMPDSSEPII